MDVTLHNFKEVLKDIKTSIDNSDFISIDTELTGLRNGSEVTAYDTPAEYYHNLRNNSLDFLVIQVGVCTFKFDQSKNKYMYDAFNFYTFPRCESRTFNSVNFLCQNTSIDFLCTANFDFNKLFREGISYLSINEEKMSRAKLSKEFADLSNCDSCTKISIPDHLRLVIEDVCNKVRDFLSPENEEVEIYFEHCNGLLRKLIYQTVEEKFPTEQFYLSTKWINNKAVLVASKGKSKNKYFKQKLEREKNEIKEAVGFSEVIQYISSSGKLIVGHNMLLDVCHIINRFLWPLPEDYREFKDMVRQIFPKIIDTKFMCSAAPFKDLIPSSVLGHMLERLHDSPFKFPVAESANPEFSYCSKEKTHEAGYDAYITGLAFVALASFLAGTNEEKEEEEQQQQRMLQLNPELTKSYENRLFLMKLVDYSHVNLEGDEATPSRKNVFHITFPEEWRTSDIVHLFAPYGNVHISYCGENAAWVTVLESSKSAMVISELIKAEGEGGSPYLRKSYKLITWREYRRRRSKHYPSTNKLQSQEEAKVTSAKSHEILVPTVTTNDKEPKQKRTVQEDRRCLPRAKKPRSTLNEKKKTSDFSSASMPGRKTNILFAQSANKETKDLQKVFEEPSWE